MASAAAPCSCRNRPSPRTLPPGSSWPRPRTAMTLPPLSGTPTTVYSTTAAGSAGGGTAAVRCWRFGTEGEAKRVWLGVCGGRGSRAGLCFEPPLPEPPSLAGGCRNTARSAPLTTAMWNREGAPGQAGAACWGGGGEGGGGEGGGGEGSKVLTLGGGGCWGLQVEHTSRWRVKAGGDSARPCCCTTIGQQRRRGEQQAPTAAPASRRHSPGAAGRVEQIPRLA